MASDLRKYLPDAVWLSGKRLHRPQDKVLHRWLDVTEETWAATLQVTTPL